MKNIEKRTENNFQFSKLIARFELLIVVNTYSKVFNTNTEMIIGILKIERFFFVFSLNWESIFKKLWK